MTDSPVLQIHPEYAIGWTDPHTLRIGFDRPVVVLHHLDQPAQAIVSTLRTGATLAHLRRVASRVSLPIDRLETLLEQLRPALIRGAAPLPRPGDSHATPPTAPPLRLSLYLDTGLRTVSWLEPRLRRLLDAHGVTVHTDRATPETIVTAGSATEDAHTVVMLSRFLPSPAVAQRFARSGAALLPVVFGDRGVTIGPRCGPRTECCLWCLAEHARDADPGWAALSVQLMGHPSPCETPEVANTVAALLVPALRDPHPKQLRLPVTAGAPSTPVTATVIERCAMCEEAAVDALLRPSPQRRDIFDDDPAEPLARAS